MYSLISIEAFASRHKGLAFARTAAQLQRLTAAWAARRRAARDLDELSRRTDYELRDMGISRSDFPAIMAGTFRRIT